MSIAKFISTLGVAAAFTVAAATAPAAFAADNAVSGPVRTMDDLMQNGWFCMRSVDGYWLCTNPFDVTYTCQLRVCWPTPMRSGDRVSRMPNGAATMAAPAPQTSGAETRSATRATPRR